MKSYIWMGIIVVVLVAALFFAVKGENTADLDPGVVVPSDHTKGLTAQASSSAVVLVEYSDFECSACRTYYFILRQLAVEFGDRVTFVYRHFPLNEIHINAKPAARAAEAAGKQGKFWEMHDLLFEKQEEWSKKAEVEAIFESYASLLGISIEQFKADFASEEVQDLVRFHRKNALKLGLQGTPSFFLNGKQIQNPRSVDEFRALISAALEK